MKTPGYLFLIIVFSLLAPIFSKAQDTVSYHTYSDSDKDLIFLEEFNNKDDTNWVNGCRCLGGRVENGYFIYEVKKSQSRSRLFDVDIDTTRNFEIEFVANVPTRNGWVSWANFSWNGQPDIKRSRKYLWTIRQDGYMRIFHRLPGAKWPSKLREGPMKIKLNDYNKYTVRRRGGNYFFYVNEQAVNTMPYKPLKGQTLGIGAGADNKRGMAIYDYVKVSYLN